MDLSLDARTEVAAKELIERLDGNKMHWSQNTAIVGVFEKDDSKHKFSGNQSCHAGLSSLVHAKRVVNALMTGEGYATGRVLDKEVEVWFVDYILNRSPHAETFITKDAEKALEQRYTVSSGDHPSNLVAAGMVALRRLWEYTYVAKAAYDLSKAGVNEDLAFLLGHVVSSCNNPQEGSPTAWTGCANGHCSVNPAAMSWKEVQNFLDHKVIHPNGLLSEGANYEGYDRMYGELGRGKGSYRTFVNENFPYERCKGAAGANLNPFTAALKANDNNQVPYGKAIEVMAEWANTTLMEKINNA